MTASEDRNRHSVSIEQLLVWAYRDRYAAMFR